MPIIRAVQGILPSPLFQFFVGVVAVTVKAMNYVW
jgi:hypothetical protein